MQRQSVWCVRQGSVSCLPPAHVRGFCRDRLFISPVGQPPTYTTPFGVIRSWRHRSIRPILAIASSALISNHSLLGESLALYWERQRCTLASSPPLPGNTAITSMK